MTSSCPLVNYRATRKVYFQTENMNTAIDDQEAPLKKSSSPPRSPQKSFSKPGTIEEVEEDEKSVGDDLYSDVLLRPGGMSKVPSVSRVSTCTSSLTYVGARQESCR